jgi:hypothetical protein
MIEQPGLPAACSAHYNKAWCQFLDNVLAARQQIGLSEHWNDTETCWYRGHSQGTYQLIPSLFRGMSTATELRERETDLYYEFRSRARQLHHLPSSWDVLFAMQHYGVPTRLLDWTECFATALFFAVAYEPAHTQRPHLWLLNPYQLNDDDLIAPENLGWDEEENEEYGYNDLLVLHGDMGWKHPVALYPEMRNDRLTAQSGMFTIHGSDHRPLESMYTAAKRNTFLARVDLPMEAVDAAREYLHMAGVHVGLLFPDLDGLAKHLRQRYPA